MLAGSGTCPGCGCAAWLVPAPLPPTDSCGSEHLVVLLLEVMGQKFQGVVNEAESKEPGLQSLEKFEALGHAPVA